MATQTLVTTHLETPSPGIRAGTAPQRLPDTLVSEQVQRLAVSAAVGAALWTYGLLMDTTVRPLTVGAIVIGSKVVIEMLGILASALMFLYVRYAPPAPQVKSDPGLM